MIQGLQLGSMLPMAVGACCAFAPTGRRDLRGRASMIVMILGMADLMVFGARLLPAPVWAVVFLMLAIVVGAQARPGASGADELSRPSPVPSAIRAMAAHRALQLIVLAGLTLLMPSTMSGMTTPGVAHSGHAGTGVSLVVGLALASAAFCGYSLWSSSRRGPEHPRTRWARVELAAGAVSVGAMTAVSLVPLAG